MDFPKVPDILNHELVITKLIAYGFETDALIYLKSCLVDRKQSLNKNFME